MRYFGGAAYMDFFTQTGILSPDQVDGSYDGTPANFVAAEGADAQQGFGSAEPYIYENEIADWGKPVAYDYINDAGWENYAESIATKPENIETYRACFEKLVPIIQQSTVDYIADPAETNALIIEAVEAFDNGWVYSEGVADYAVETMQADGLLGNGPDETVGNFDLDRVNELIEKARPGVRRARPGAARRPHRRGHRHQRVHRRLHRFLTVEPLMVVGVPSATMSDIKPRSRDVTDGMQKAPARAMLRAIGLTDDDWAKPQVGIANSWNEITPCNMTLRTLAEHVRTGIRESGGVAMEFGTITVSDAISMGHEGMRASLVSRDLSCDSVETVVFAERLDGFVGMAGCDKSMPAMLMASARLDLASILVYNGSIMPGQHDGKAIDVTSVFEAVGACAAGAITLEELDEIERGACPGEGACGGMFTANTMSSIGEALGMSLPGSASPPAIDPPPPRRRPRRRRGGRAHARAGITPRMIMTKPAFENAIALTSALGGSTNAVLHLLAIANEAGVELHLDDFNRIAARVPHIADMKPGGKFHMSDLDRVGGVPVVLRHLLDAGLLDGDCLTVTGKTMAENLAALDPPAPDGVVVHPVDAPIHPQGGINILTGSLAPLGSVVKVAGLTAGAARVRGHGERLRRRGRGDGRDPRRPGRSRARCS